MDPDATAPDAWDALILAVVGVHWRKVALVIGLVSKRVGRVPDDELGHEIAARIVALVQAGRLESQGNLARWRYSEVRLPSGATLP